MLSCEIFEGCGSVVWVVGIISRVQETCAKLYLVVILTLGLYKLGVTCVGVEQRTHMEVSSQILGPATGETKQWQHPNEVNFCVCSYLCAHLEI